MPLATPMPRDPWSSNVEIEIVIRLHISSIRRLDMVWFTPIISLSLSVVMLPLPTGPAPDPPPPRSLTSSFHSSHSLSYSSLSCTLSSVSRTLSSTDESFSTSSAAPGFYCALGLGTSFYLSKSDSFYSRSVAGADGFHEAFYPCGVMSGLSFSTSLRSFSSISAECYFLSLRSGDTPLCFPPWSYDWSRNSSSRLWILRPWACG